MAEVVTAEAAQRIPFHEDAFARRSRDVTVEVGQVDAAPADRRGDERVGAAVDEFVEVALEEWDELCRQGDRAAGSLSATLERPPARLARSKKALGHCGIRSSDGYGGGAAAESGEAREQESINRCAPELQEGYGDSRFSGYVTVSAASEDELDVACSDVVHAAQQSGLELRRLAGEQDAAFTYTLPPGRGLP